MTSIPGLRFQFTFHNAIPIPNTTQVTIQSYSKTLVLSQVEHHDLSFVAFSRPNVAMLEFSSYEAENPLEVI